jgi:hypothetical protein
MGNKTLDEHLEEDRNKYFTIFNKNSGNFLTSSKAYDIYTYLQKVIENYKDYYKDLVQMEWTSQDVIFWSYLPDAPVNELCGTRED